MLSCEVDFFFFSSRRRHTRFDCDWSSTCAFRSMSCRMVPNQRGARIMELIRNFVKERAPEVEIVAESCLEPYRGSSTGPYADALRDAYNFGFRSEERRVGKEWRSRCAAQPLRKN